MAQTHSDTNVNQLIINKMTKQEYDNLPQTSDTELYLVEEQVDSVVTQGSTNPVQSGAVYDAIQDNQGIIFCHMLSGAIFNETIVECTEINGEIFDPQELIDSPNDPSPLSPDGNYYYASNTNKVYGGEVGDNEFIDVTASIIIVGDETKLYCDIDDNKLYRYDGTNFIMVGGGNITSYNDLTDKPLSVESNKVKYTLSDGTTKLTLAQEGDFVAKAGDTMTGTLILSKTQDASGNANNKPALIVGGTDSQEHIEIDGNEIIAKSNGTTGNTLYLNDGKGAIELGGSDYSVHNPAKFRAAINVKSITITTEELSSFNGGTFEGKIILSCYVTVSGVYSFSYYNALQVGNTLTLYGNRNGVSHHVVVISGSTTSANAWGVSHGLDYACFTYATLS